MGAAGDAQVGAAGDGDDAGGAARAPRWHALWAHSHCERLVNDQLLGRGFDTFLPEIEVWSRRDGRRRTCLVPMFPGYLFLRHAMDKGSYVEVSRARGLVRILGETWDRLAVVPDDEIDAIRKVLAAQLHPFPHPFLREGQRARVRGGPLAGVEGILLGTRPDRGLLVLSVELFQRSIAVEIDGTLVAPA